MSCGSSQVQCLPPKATLLFFQGITGAVGATGPLGPTGPQGTPGTPGGATGPTGNRYGDAAGHVCIAVAGPMESAVTVETGRNERAENMRAFAALALQQLLAALAKAPRNSA